MLDFTSDSETMFKLHPCSIPFFIFYLFMNDVFLRMCIFVEIKTFSKMVCILLGYAFLTFSVDFLSDKKVNYNMNQI